MRIDKLTLLNFRCFKQLDITFDEHITILVAPNGAGKTTVLDAVRLALSPFLRGLDSAFSNTEDDISITTGDLRLVYNPGELNMEIATPTSLITKGRWGAGKTMQWQLSRKGDQPVVEDANALRLSKWSEQLQEEVREEARKTSIELPLLLYLGTARLWYQGRHKLDLKKHRLDNSAYSRLSGYDECLSAASGYEQFDRWYKWICRSHLEFQIRRLENLRLRPNDIQLADKLKDAIQVIQQSINAFTLEATGWHDLEYSSSLNEQLVMNHAIHGKIPLGQLSDGLRNTVAMVADIAFRCVKLNPHLCEQAALKTQGIVLIDEVDMFLHPAWQQRIIQALRNAFPLIQFIVTTHSPQVISTVKRDSIRLLEQDKKGNGFAAMPLGATYGEPSNDVLQSVMQVDPQPPVVERDSLHRLTALVDQGQYDKPEAMKLMQSLIASLGETHPQLQRLQRSIARQNMLKEKP